MTTDSTQPLVTVYFLTYNRPHLFPAGLRSIQRQTFRNFEVIVVDNGSTPPITLPDDIAADPRFILFRNDDNDQGRAVYFDLLRAIKTRYTAFLFDDDRWHPEKLERQLAALEAMPNVVACFSHASLIDTEDRPLPHLEQFNPFNTFNRSRGAWVKRFFFEGNCLCQPSAVMRTAVLQERVPLLPFFQLPDLALWVNLLAAGDFHIVEHPLTLFSWAGDGSNESAIVSPAAHNRQDYEYSRIYHQLAAMPEDVLREAFDLPPTAVAGNIEEAVFAGAVLCGTPAHFRFAAEYAEARFTQHYLAGDRAAVSRWSQNFRVGSSQMREAAGTGSSTSGGARVDSAYQTWLATREPLPDDGAFIALRDPAPAFQVVVRLAPGQEDLLASTLDALGRQVLGGWHLDVVTPLPAPPGLDGVPCIAWHTLGDQTAGKAYIDACVEQRQCDWVLEIPPGAQLDPLYLWHLAKTAEDVEAAAFFVDDDCTGPDGNRHSPRFKPGANRERLRSGDLAGPLCLRRALWQAIGGAGPGGSPWFWQLMNLYAIGAEETLVHIPDVLISYRDNFPSDTRACLTALLGQATDNGPLQIVPRTGSCWTVRPPLPASAPVTVAVLSEGQLDLLRPCVESLLASTAYRPFELLIVLTLTTSDRHVQAWLDGLTATGDVSLRVATTAPAANHAQRCNLAVDQASHPKIVLLREEATVIDDAWLADLLQTAGDLGIGAVMPTYLRPDGEQITGAGPVLGLGGELGLPYAGTRTNSGETGYLDLLVAPRDIAALGEGCLMIDKAACLAVGGFDEALVGGSLPEIDCALRLRGAGYRLLFQPAAKIGYGGRKPILIVDDCDTTLREKAAEQLALESLHRHWGKALADDPYWNPNLSLGSVTPMIEAAYASPWRHLPNDKPHLFAHYLGNGQGWARITSPLKAARRFGLAMESLWEQTGNRVPTLADLVRLAPDAAIVQHYVNDAYLSTLNSWSRSPARPFTVYAIDDLITQLDLGNSFRKYVPANSYGRLKYALARCDRLVASTPFLADYCSAFIADVRVVPNRLDPEVWLPLSSGKRRGQRPRIGWAGGETHYADLILLREVIERTADEADWVFFGMCPDELRPYVKEFHSVEPLANYPGRLASLDLDLAVAPLAVTPFNRGKSNLRLLEYGILGIPTVCTDIEPYRDSPACRVPNTTEAWLEALRARIHDAEAREREGAAMAAWVRDHFLLTPETVGEWLQAHLPEKC